MNRDLDQILDYCLSGLQAGNITLESCLEQFPEHTEELGPLLQLAAHSHTVLAPSGPSPSFIETTRIRILNRLQKHADKPSPQSTLQKRSRRLFLRPAYVIVASALVLTLLVSGFGVVRASANSLPGDGLYGVKLASEQIRLGINLSTKSDRALLIGFANERLEEAQKLLELERFNDLELAMRGLDETLESLALISVGEDDEDPGSLTHIEEKIAKHKESLLRILEQVPDSARSAIENAIERSSKSQEVIKKVKAENHPSNSAPGQLKKDGEGENQEDLRPGQGNGRDKIKPNKPTKTEKAPDTEE